MATFALHSCLERPGRWHPSRAVASKTFFDHVPRLSPTQRLFSRTRATGGMTHREVKPISGGIITDAMLEESSSPERNRRFGPAARAEDPFNQSRRALPSPPRGDFDGLALPFVCQKETIARFTDGPVVRKRLIEAASQNRLQGVGMRGRGVGGCLARVTNAAWLRGKLPQRQERADQTDNTHNPCSIANRSLGPIALKIEVFLTSDHSPHLSQAVPAHRMRLGPRRILARRAAAPARKAIGTAVPRALHRCGGGGGPDARRSSMAESIASTTSSRPSAAAPRSSTTTTTAGSTSFC